jgi:4-amino-4-deoxy-L-arabinose transferase-like glycosyltransferase
LAAYIILAAIYSFATPPFEASDELWHYPMVKYLADSGLRLPQQDVTVQTAWRQEGSQPPLYYLMAAALTFWIDTSDMDYWRRLNPHADIGVVRPDGNANMVVHRPDEAQNRFTGALLALQICRFFSIALGAGTVWATYLLGRTLFPERLNVALVGAAFNAFLPMFLFISSSVNNDNLSNLLGNLLTLLIVRLLLGLDRPRWPAYTALGLAAGAGILSKLSIGFFIPLIALSLLIISIRHRSWQPFVLGSFVSGTLTIVIAGWWYLRNLQLYNEPTGLSTFLSITGRRAIPANAAQLWSERDSYLQAFWGFFGGMNVPMPADVYATFNFLGLMGMASAVLFVAWRISTKPNSQLGAAHMMTILWIVITFASYLRWTAETPASQGRLVFVALSSICVWLALGWTHWLRARRQWIGALPAVYSFAIALWFPRPSMPYTIQGWPERLGDTTHVNISTAQDTSAEWPVEVTFQATGDDSAAFDLTLAAVTPMEARPETYATFAFGWRVRSPSTRDWSIFVHLVTQDDLIVAQRDVYPARGLLATSDLARGYEWYNPVAVWIPNNAYAPQTLDIVVGWYDQATGERMRIVDNAVVYTIGQIELLPRAVGLDVPNPVSVNFARQIELIGYSLSDLTPAQGQTVELTLYWRGLVKPTADYVVFAQIIDRATTSIYAASDAMPAAWTRPTTTWAPGEIVEDSHTLVVNPNTLPGIYDIHLGLYTRGEDGSFNRLRVVTPDGGEAFDYTELTRVRVVPEGS